MFSMSVIVLARIGRLLLGDTLVVGCCYIDQETKEVEMVSNVFYVILDAVLGTGFYRVDKDIALEEKIVCVEKLDFKRASRGLYFRTRGLIRLRKDMAGTPLFTLSYIKPATQLNIIYPIHLAINQRRLSSLEVKNAIDSGASFEEIGLLLLKIKEEVSEVDMIDFEGEDYTFTNNEIPNLSELTPVQLLENVSNSAM